MFNNLLSAVVDSAAPTLSPRPRIGLPGQEARHIPRGELVQLRDSVLQVYPFETRRAGESRSCPPRTVGHTSMVLVGGDRRLDWVEPADAVELCLQTPEEKRSADAAVGKVVFCNRLGETQVYQTDRAGRSAALCACGNATGAAAAMLAHCLGRRRLAHNVKLPEGRVDMKATATVTEDGGWRVEQAWGGIRLQAAAAEVGVRKAAVCTGIFNDYLVIRLRDRAELEALSMEEVQALWRAGRQFGAFENPLQSRLAAVAPDGARPCARFFTCGRMHPGAPLTGLATLAVTARRVGWLASLLQGGEIEHRRGVDAIPAVRLTPRGAEIQFPPLHVVLHGV
jgi:hypothetical protein